MEQTPHKESTLATWVVIILCVLLILIQGLFAFSVVGDRGQPNWDYRPVKDVPGESPYAMYQKLPYPQHVKGSEGE
ncbi:MAG: hypothetical protein JSW56_14125 [Deltaproteobacteria bacterium]|nr:MAG: hypothetical protein JSW56_14125 [Deltaproteobacteria bacterium]